MESTNLKAENALLCRINANLIQSTDQFRNISSHVDIMKIFRNRLLILSKER